MTYRQNPPNAVQVELTEGCNLACSFCGIQGIRDNGADGSKGIHGKGSQPYHFMTLADGKKVAARLAEAKWNPRIEFAMHGEPSLNPYAARIIAGFRRALPTQYLMMTSNGGGFMADPTASIGALFDAGLNVLLLDDYDQVNIVDKVMERYRGNAAVTHYPLDKKANPHRRRKAHEQEIVLVADIASADDGNHATLNNHCGSGAPLNFAAAGKRCAKPFREISVRFDGNVAICCNDWRGVYKCGNILDVPAETLWQGEPFQVARKFLYHGDRTFPPCYGCDALSYRPGLLPDRMGKETLPEPTGEDRELAMAATVGRSYAAPVQRPWE